MNLLDLEVATGIPGNPAYFTGSVLLTTASEDLGPVKLIRVEFAPRARTHWHTHSGAQLLFVVAGACRYQQWGGPLLEARAGQVVHIPAGEKHWHGAVPGGAMVHLAVNIALETQWLEAVSDEQYTAG
ncbi:MAG: cupin domain-containing protein [Thermoanaerobaculia bacterium]